MTVSPSPQKPGHITRELLVATVLYVLLAVVITWPVAAQLSRVVGGFDGRDSFQHVWLFWWFWEALVARAHAPWLVDALYFPQGAAHPVLWLHPLAPLFGLPLTATFGPRTAYNLLLLFSLALTGSAGYLLARDIVRHPAAAFIGGLIFAFAPTRLGHTLAGHQLLVFAVALPLYALALRLWLRRPSRRRAVLYTVALWLALISHPNFIGFFLLPVTLVLLLAHGWQQRRFLIPQWRQLLTAWVVAGATFLPFAAPLLLELSGQNLNYLTPTNPAEHAADLLSLVTPSPFHPLWGDAPLPLLTTVLDSPRALEEGFNYIGLAVLVLATLGLWWRWQRTRMWLALALLSGVLALGPVLKIGGQITRLPLPYTLLIDLPFFAWGRTPGRLNITTMLAVSVIAAAGAEWLLGRWRSRAVGWLLVTALSLIILLEYLPLWPFPTDPLAVPPVYQELAMQPGAALLDLPVTGSRRASNYAMLYQTIHHAPMVNGYIERDPPGTQEIQQFTDRLLSPPPVLPEVLTTPTLEERRAILSDLGLTHVIAHPQQMTDRAARATLGFAPHVLGESSHADDTLQLWLLPPADTPPPPLALLPAEDGWEGLNDGTMLRLKESGLLFVYAAESGPATLRLEPATPLPDGLELRVNNETVAASVVMTAPLILHPKLNWISLSLAGCDSCDLDFSRITLEPEAKP